MWSELIGFILNITNETNKIRVSEKSKKFMINEITSDDGKFNETEVCTPISETHLSCLTTGKMTHIINLIT